MRERLTFHFELRTRRVNFRFFFLFFFSFFLFFQIKSRSRLVTPPKKQLSKIKRAQIVALSGEGYSRVEIAGKMECSRNGVQTTIKRYKVTKSFENRKGQGRKKSTTAREDKSLKRVSLTDRRKSSSELVAELRKGANKNISARTVRRRLLEVGLKGCKTRKKPYLSQANKKKRLEFSKNHENWTPDDWGKIVWSDESNFEVS